VLRQKLTPNYPMGCKRQLVSDEWYDTLVRPNVEVVDTAIERIEPDGVRTRDGQVRRVDAIIYGTGFTPTAFLTPMRITGLAGRDLNEAWRDGAEAYLGITVTGFPNFFMIYGPNTNNSGGLQIVDFEEMVTRFALQCFSRMIIRKEHTIDVKPDAYWRYNDELDRYEAMMIYKDQRANNYYQNESGRSPCNCPIDVRKIWTWLRNPAAGQVEGRTGDAEAIANPFVRPYFGEDLVVE